MPDPQPAWIRLSDYATAADLEPHLSPCPDCDGQRMYRFGCWNAGDSEGTCTCPDPQETLGLFANAPTIEDVKIRGWGGGEVSE